MCFHDRKDLSFTRFVCACTSRRWISEYALLTKSQGWNNNFQQWSRSLQGLLLIVFANSFPFRTVWSCDILQSDLVSAWYHLPLFPLNDARRHQEESLSYYRRRKSVFSEGVGQKMLNAPLVPFAHDGFECR